MTQIRPLLLALLNKFPPKKVSEAFKLLVSAAVRYQMVGGIGGGTLEKEYADTAKAVTEEKIKTPEEVIQAFKNVPSDSAFLSAFSIASVSKQKVARYYLRELEIAEASDNAQTIPNHDTNSVNLEHVLPTTPDPVWKNLFTDNEMRSYQKRIGNLAIMSAKLNSTIGNGCFNDKKEHYKDSAFIFTRELANEDSWGKKAIDSRQKKMAEVAVKHWSLG